MPLRVLTLLLAASCGAGPRAPTASSQQEPPPPPDSGFGPPYGSTPIAPPPLDEIAAPTLSRTPVLDASGQTLCGVPPDEETAIAFQSRNAWHSLTVDGLDIRERPSAEEALGDRFSEVAHACDLEVAISHRRYPARLYRTRRANPEPLYFDPRSWVVRAPSAGPCEVPADEAVIVVARRWNSGDSTWDSEAFSDLTDWEYLGSHALSFLLSLIADGIPDPPAVSDTACTAWLDADTQLILWRLGVPSPREETLMQSLVQDYLRGVRKGPAEGS